MILLNCMDLYITIKENKKQNKKEKDLIDEFSGAGAIAGYVLPLGSSNKENKK